MKKFANFYWVLLAFAISGCAHSMSMTAIDGAKYTGRYRFGREDNGLMQIYGPDNEMLIGNFTRVGRTAFAENYEKTFGRGTIELDGPDLSRHGGSIGGVLGTSSVFHETAYADPESESAGKKTKVISGPLFYWIAHLQGDRRTVLGCYLVGSAYTGNGFGRCKSQSGNEFRIDF